MKAKSKAAFVEHLKEVIKSFGYTKSRHSATKYNKEKNGNHYRFCFNANALRKEGRVDHPPTQYSPASVTWVRLGSGFYKDLTIVEGEDGIKRISGLKR